MGRETKPLQKGFLSLNFGDVCKAYKAAYEQSHHGKTLAQEKAVSAILELVFTDKALEDMVTEFFVLPREGNHFLTHKKRVYKQIRYELRVLPKGLIQNNFENRILPTLNQDGWELFLNSLQEMVENLPDSCDFMSLKQDIGRLDKCLNLKFVERCISFCLYMPNTPGETVKWENHNFVPDIHSKYDPYRLVSKDIGSKAVNIQLIILGPDQQTSEETFHNFGEVIDLIFQQSLIINDIKYDNAAIKVLGTQNPRLNYTLRKLTRQDSHVAESFVRQHEQEFLPKVSWGNRRLSEMIENGLSTGQWTAYGYFDSEENLIAYLDCKIRIDGGVELGSLLTKPECRRYSLASSLVCLYKLLYPHCRVFGGTFEENDKMIKTFQATGFSRILYYDRKTLQTTKTVQERINPDYPDDPEKYTNSVYFFSESIIAQAFSSKVD